ncbi:MAG: AAA family ATPase [Bacteroidales bacterium]|nr:AAA family ATPase [Bacteroidales bacterium]
MIIRREIINRFKRWKDAPQRKPILLKGARQIGKTWVMEAFGKECFDYCAKFDFDRQPEVKSAFQVSKDPQRILKELALYSEVPLLPGKTLLVFDEIQECEEAFNSLKYFCEEAPDYHIIAAGSLLGVAVKRRRMSVPVGKVELEFLVQWNDEIVPVEVKAENCVSGRSITVYNEKYHPKYRIRYSFLNLQFNCGMLSCPSPLAEWSWKWLE